MVVVVFTGKSGKDCECKSNYSYGGAKSPGESLRYEEKIRRVCVVIYGGNSYLLLGKVNAGGRRHI